MTPGGGSAPPDPPALCVLDVFCLNLAVFSNPPRKLSLPPSDRARRCDSDAPIERLAAYISRRVSATFFTLPSQVVPKPLGDIFLDSCSR